MASTVTHLPRTANLEVLKRAHEYRERYGLDVVVRDGSIISITRNGGLHVLSINRHLGLDIRAGLKKAGFAPQIMASRGVVMWKILVAADLPLEQHLDLSARLIRDQSISRRLSSPNSVITFPTPGVQRCSWVCEPVDAARPPLSQVLEIAGIDVPQPPTGGLRIV